jgi:hypothetical protein
MSCSRRAFSRSYSSRSRAPASACPSSRTCSSLVGVVPKIGVLLLVELEEVPMEVEDLGDLLPVAITFFELLSVPRNLLVFGDHPTLLLVFEQFWRLHPSVKFAV